MSIKANQTMRWMDADWRLRRFTSFGGFSKLFAASSSFLRNLKFIMDFKRSTSSSYVSRDAE